MEKCPFTHKLDLKNLLRNNETRREAEDRKASRLLLLSHRAAFIALLNQLWFICRGRAQQKIRRHIYDVCFFNSPFMATQREEKEPEMKSRPYVKVTSLSLSLSPRVFFNFPFHLKLLYRKWIQRNAIRFFCSFLFRCYWITNGKISVIWVLPFFFSIHFFCFNYHTQKHTFSVSIVRPAIYIVRCTIHFPNYNPIIVYSSKICCVCVVEAREEESEKEIPPICTSNKGKHAFFPAVNGNSK